MRVLIAEDDFASRILLDAVLLKWGYEVVPANDGEAALEIMQGETAPPIAILDWMMPKLSGIDVCQLARKQTRELVPYILMLTAKGQKTDISEGLDAGADDYLVKPFDLIELGARLRVARRAIALQSALLDSQRTVRYQALHDISTGALNRGAILTALGESMQSDGHVTVTLYSINDHKGRQEREGVPSAEAAVRGVVQRLRAGLPDAQIGRYGPDELLVVQRGASDANVAQSASHILDDVGSPDFSRAHGAGSPIGVSAGVVNWDGSASLELLLCYADAALYAARTAGTGLEIFGLNVEPGNH